MKVNNIENKLENQHDFYNFDIQIAKWCSENVYKTDTEIRAYIRNEITQRFYLLEGFSAIIWSMIKNSQNYKDILSYILSHGYTQVDLDSLLSELYNEDLIIDGSKNIQPKYTYCNNTDTSFVESEDIDYNKFTLKMFNWLQHNNFLAELHIDLTYKCNQNCIHCYNHKNMTNFEIKFEDIKKTIDEAYELGLFSVTLSGGESTLCSDFLKIAEYIRKKRIHLIIFTNGQSLYNNEFLMNKIASIYPARVSFTVFSMNPKVHDMISKVESSHEKTINVIEKLVEKHVPTEIKCFLTKYNALDYKDVSKYAKEHKVQIVLLDMKFYNNPENNNSNVQVSDGQLLEIFKGYGLYLGKKLDKNTDIFASERKEYTPCRAGHASLAIMPNCDVNICIFIDEKIGNIKEESIKDIWFERTKNVKKLHDWRQVTIGMLKDCYKHEYCGFCFYCAGFADSYLGKSDTLCRVAKMKYKVYLDEQEKSII